MMTGIPAGTDLEPRVAAVFAGLAGLAASEEDLARRGRFLSAECLLGSFGAPVHVSIVAGRIAEVSPRPALMRSWRFAFRATPQAWAEFWQPVPPPGWHDLLALAKRGAASVEGDLHPFLSNLQYFKDLLALPRGRFARDAA